MTKKLNGTVIVTYRCNARCTMCNRYKAPSRLEDYGKQIYGTPVRGGGNFGGILELIRVGETGELFESGNIEQLIDSIPNMWENYAMTSEYTENCRRNEFCSAAQYGQRLMKVYMGVE